MKTKIKNRFVMVIGFVASFAIGFYLNGFFVKKENTEIINTEQQNNMKLGAFSISLNVKDLKNFTKS